MYRVILFFLFFILLNQCSDSEPKSQFIDPETSKEIKDYDLLIWSDEFNDFNLNLEKWDIEETPDLRNVGGNHELQYYVDNPSNIFIYKDNEMNSSLCITAINMYGEYCTSGKITTLDKFHFKYGRVQARIKAPYGAGVWPAFWALGVNTRIQGKGWPLSGEIDIMELWGDKEEQNFSTSELYGTIHYGNKWPNNKFSGPTTRKIHEKIIANFGLDYHIYEMNWTPDEISWSVDGYPYGSVKKESWYTSISEDEYAPFNDNFYLILNVAIGGGSFYDKIKDEELINILSGKDYKSKLKVIDFNNSTMYVDWVRVFSN